MSFAASAAPMPDVEPMSRTFLYWNGILGLRKSCFESTFYELLVELKAIDQERLVGLAHEQNQWRRKCISRYTSLADAILELET